MKIKKFSLKPIIILLIVTTWMFMPIFESINAMSYNYDFWNNVLPSAEGIAHSDTYYASSFPYYKNEPYEELRQNVKDYIDRYSLNEIGSLIYDPDYRTLTEDVYNQAHQMVNASQLAPNQKIELNQLLDQKQEYEADPNLYAQINFDNLSDVVVYGDKIYVLATPASGVTITNISGTSTITNITKLIVINSDMKWEVYQEEFLINDEVKQAFDDYYQWNSLRFTSVAMGDNHAIGVDTSGNLWAWGDNSQGQLALDPTVHTSITTPYQVTWIGDSSTTVYSSVYATGNTSYALDANGAVYAWGSNEHNLLAQPSTVTSSYVPTRITLEDRTVTGLADSLITSDDHVYVIDKSNNLWAWGNGNDGLLGESYRSVYDTPQLIIVAPSGTQNENNPAFKTLVAGINHTVGIDSSDALWVWGKNTYGQLGLGHTNDVFTPTKLTINKNGVNVKTTFVAVGDNHTLVVDNIGSLWSMGQNNQLQLGVQGITQSLEPYMVNDTLDFETVYASGNSSYAITENNQIYAAGSNENQILGLGVNAPSTTELIPLNTSASITKVISTSDAAFGIDATSRLWVWGTSDTKLGIVNQVGVVEDLLVPTYEKRNLQLKNISVSELSASDIYRRAVYIASSADETVPSIILRSASGVTVSEDFIYIADTENSRILKLNKETLIVEEVCLTPDDSTFRNLNLDVSVNQGSTARQFRPTKIAVDKTGRIYCIASQVYEGIIEFNRAGNFNRYLGKNEVTANPIKERLQNFLSEAQLATFELTLPPLFTNINISTDQFIYATSYPESTTTITTESAKMIKAVNTSGKDVLRRNGFVEPMGDARFYVGASDPSVIIGPSSLVDIAINDNGNYTAVDETRGRLFTYDSEGNLLYIAGDQPGGNKQSSSGLAQNIIKPVGIDYYKRSYISATNEEVIEEIIIVADQTSKSLMFYETTEFGELVNEATATYAKGVDTAEKAESVRAIWEEVIKMNTNYELAYLGIGKCLLVESDYIDDKDQQIALFQEAMENFKLAHSQTYYSKAYSRYRDQVLKDNFALIMALAITAILIIVTLVVVLKVLAAQKKRMLKRVQVEGDEEHDNVS